MAAVPLTSPRTGLDDRLDALVGGPDVRAGVAGALRSHYDAARDKIALRLTAGLGAWRSPANTLWPPTTS